MHERAAMARMTMIAVIVVVVVVAAFGGFALAKRPAAVTTTTLSPNPGDSSIQSSSTGSTGMTTTSISVASTSSTLNASWVPGQPVRVSMVETDNFSASGNAYALNPSTNTIYILETSSLTAINASSGSVMANVALPANNTGGLVIAGLTININTDMVYASVQGGVVEVNGSTNKFVGEIHLGVGTLAIDSATNELWGTVFGNQGPGSQNGSLVGLDAGTDSVLANVSLGFAPYDIAVNPYSDTVYVDGCSNFFVCGSEVAIVNGTTGTLTATIDLGSADYPTMALDPVTGVLYVSGGQQLAALNGTNGDVIFNENPQTCGPFTGIVVDPLSNLVLTAPSGSNYLLAYNGTSGKLVNMYSFPSNPGPVVFDSDNGKLYVATSAGDLIAMHMFATTGNVDAALIGPSEGCPLP